MIMFNQEQKLQFLNSLQDDNNNIKSYKQLFAKLFIKAEKDYNKDIAEMSYEELKISIALLGGRDVKSIAWNISRLKQYIDWAIINGRTSQLENYLNLLTPDEIDNSYVYNREMLASPDDLQEKLDIVYPPIEILHLYNMHRIFMWLLFEGCTSNEASYLERKNIDLENNKIYVGEKVIEPNAMFRDLLQITIPEDKLVKKNRNGEERYYDLCESEYAIRMFKFTNINRPKQFGMRITEFNNRYKAETGQYIKLSPIRIYESGVFWRWYQLEINNQEIPFDSFVENDMDGKIFVTEEKYVFNEKKRDIKDAYKKWKKAFDY